MIKERKLSADLIRVIAASAIVIVHIASMVYYDLDRIGYRWWLISNTLSWGLRWATPLFVMISGYFLLNSDLTNHSRLFFRRRFSKLVIPYFFWSLFYYFLNHEGDYGLNSPVEFLDKLWRSSTYYHLYFVNVILGLYLVTPLIKRHILNKNLNFITPLLLSCSTLYLIASTYFGFPQANNIFTWFMSYVGFYVAGYWIGKMRRPQHPHAYLFLGTVLLSIGVLVTRKTFFLFENQEMATILVKHFSPIIILTTLGFFYFAINLKNSSLGPLSKLARLSTLSLGVYFIHPFWISLLVKIPLINTIYLENYGLWLISMIILTILSSFLSIFTLQKIPYLKNLS